MEVQHIS